MDSTGKTQRAIVRDKVTGQIYMRKTLSVYNVAVFEYLRTHRDSHIPAVISYWEQDGRLTVIEELVQGVTLDSLLQQGALSRQDRIRILESICEGLAFLHHAQPLIVHRDIKEQNIMVTDSGNVKVIDYDAARQFVPDAVRDTELFGTHGNAAPEQYGFAQSDARTDIFALGAMMKRMFPDVPDMQKIADKAMTIDPDKRYQSAEQMLRAIRRKGKHSKRRLIPIAIAAGALVFALTGFLIFTALHSLRDRQAADTTETKNETQVSVQQNDTGKATDISAIQDNTDIVTDTSATQDNGTADASDIQETVVTDEQLQVVESGYYTVRNHGVLSVYYAYELYNPDPVNAAELPSIQVVAKDTDGKILSVDDNVLNGVPAGEHILHTGLILYEGPETVSELTVTVGSVLFYTPQRDAMCLASSQFEVTNVTQLKSSDNGTKYTGQIKNNSDRDCDFAVSVIYRLNGEIIGGETDFMTSVAAGRTGAFELLTYAEPEEYDTYQVYVKSW